MQIESHEMFSLGCSDVFDAVGEGEGVSVVWMIAEIYDVTAARKVARTSKLPQLDCLIKTRS
jgi:hypothetical protein